MKALHILAKLCKRKALQQKRDCSKTRLLKPYNKVNMFYKNTEIILFVSNTNKIRDKFAKNDVDIYRYI